MFMSVFLHSTGTFFPVELKKLKSFKTFNILTDSFNLSINNFMFTVNIGQNFVFLF